MAECGLLTNRRRDLAGGPNVAVWRVCRVKAVYAAVEAAVEVGRVLAV